MRQTLFYCIALIATTLFAQAKLQADDSKSAPLPRYKFEPGTQLEYTGTDRFDYVGADDKKEPKEKKSMESEYRWTISVLSANEDKSWRILVRHVSIDKRWPDTPQTQLGYFDLSPNGVITSNPTVKYCGLEQIFPALPNNEKELREGWKSSNKLRNITWHHQRVDAKSEKFFVIQSQQFQKLDPIYGFEGRITAAFDPEKGRLQYANEWGKQEWWFNGEGTTKIEFQSTSKINPKQLDLMLNDQDIYFSTMDGVKKLMRSERVLRLASCEDVLKEANSLLLDTKKNLQSTVFIESIDREIKSQVDQDRWARKNAKEFDAVIDHPAPEWTLKDTDDKEHKSSDYLGKIVVLDMWRRGCGHCIEGMPAIKKLVEQYKDKPVEIIGLNFDEDVNDAKIVIEKVGLNYVTLQAHETRDKEFLTRGWPGYWIIDQKGIVRFVQIGDRPNLSEILTEQIDKLLKQ